MRNSSLGYIIASAFRGMRKHFMMTMASISVLIACMVIIGTAFLFSENVSHFMTKIEKENEIIAFIKDFDDYETGTYSDDITSENTEKVDSEKEDETNDTESLEDEADTDTVDSQDYNRDVILSGLNDEFKALKGVGEIRFVTREQALVEYRAILGEDGSYLDSFGGENNPLRDSFVITVKNLDQFKKISSSISANPHIAHVRDTQNIVNMLISLRNVVNILSVVILLILGIVSLFIIYNTIKIAMYNRKNEINIMKYVGATNWFIRWPFIFEGLFIGVVAATISFGIEWLVYNQLFTKVFSTLNFIDLMTFDALYVPLLVIFAAIGVVVGVFGSLTSIRKYLNA